MIEGPGHDKGSAELEEVVGGGLQVGAQGSQRRRVEGGRLRSSELRVPFLASYLAYKER